MEDAHLLNRVLDASTSLRSTYQNHSGCPAQERRQQPTHTQKKKKKKMGTRNKICKSDKIMLNQKLVTEHFAYDLHSSPSASRD
jgi:hypothetical protein